MKKTTIFLMLTFLILGLPLQNCFIQKDTGKLYGGTLVIAVPSDPTTTVPSLDSNFTTQVLGWLIYSTLINLDKDLNPRPNLAESWEISPDKSKYTFHLIKNATWDDGKPFTSADVVFTFEEIVKKHNPFGIINYKDLKVYSLNDYTVVFDFKKPFPTFMLYLDLPYYGGAILPKHLWEGRDVRTNPYNIIHTVGTGPFVFKEYAKKKYMAYIKNGKYFKLGLPYLNNIIIKIIPDPTERLLALERGEVDLLLGETIRLKDFERIKKNQNIDLVFGYDRAIGKIYAIAFNLRIEKITSNSKVRQAITMAINREKIHKLIAFGNGEVLYGPVPTTTAFYNSDIPKLRYNPETAEKLLDEAGYHRGADGTRFELNYLYTPTPFEAKEIGELIAEDLKNVGIKLKMDFANATSWKSRISNGNWDMLPWTARTGPDPAFAIAEHFSKNFLWPFGYNVAHYHNPAVEDLFVKAQFEANETRRMKMIHQLQAIIASDTPYLFLFSVPQPNAISKEFPGFNNGPWGSQSVEKTYWVKGKPVNETLESFSGSFIHDSLKIVTSLSISTIIIVAIIWIYRRRVSFRTIK
ncbi:MAG: ABC transporter substrate-binding protein [Candidatus Bathyarchaeia archaeon]